MKPLKINLITSLLLLVTVFSCKKEDNSANNNTQISNNIVQGSWRMTLYNEDGNDELHHFTGYTFTFNNGTATAVKSGTTVTGTYSLIVDDSKNKILFDFGAVVPFNDLNDDWQVLESTAAVFRLQHVSGGNGGTDLLTFEKN